MFFKNTIGRKNKLLRFIFLSVSEIGSKDKKTWKEEEKKKEKIEEKTRRKRRRKRIQIFVESDFIQIST